MTWMDGLADRATSMGRMMDRLGVDMETAAAQTRGTALAAAIRRCAACRELDTCRRWLDQADGNAPDFCPNRDFFEATARSCPD